MQLILLLNALPYVAAWWLALRVVFGTRLEPLEWIVVGIGAFGVPAALLDFVHPAWLAEALAACWEALPVPLIFGDCVRQWRTAHRATRDGVSAFLHFKQSPSEMPEPCPNIPR